MYRFETKAYHRIVGYVYLHNIRRDDFHLFEDLKSPDTLGIIVQAKIYWRINYDKDLSLVTSIK